MSGTSINFITARTYSANSPLTSDPKRSHAAQAVPVPRQQVPANAPPLQNRVNPINQGKDATNILSILELLTENPGESEQASRLSDLASKSKSVVGDLCYFGTNLSALNVKSAYSNPLQGLDTAAKAWVSFKQASHDQDAKEQIKTGSEFIVGVSQLVGGASYLTYGASTFAKEIASVHGAATAASAMGKVSQSVSLIGNVFFTFFFLFTSVVNGLNFYHTTKFAIGFKNASAEKVNRIVPFLLSQIHSDLHATLQQQSKRKEDYKNELEQRCVQEFTHHLIAEQKRLAKEGKLNGPMMSRSQIQAAIPQLFEQLGKNDKAKNDYLENYRQKLGLTAEEMKDWDLTPMQICGLKFEAERGQRLKQRHIERVIGSTGLEALQHAYKHGLVERLAADHPMVKAAAETDAATLEKTIRSALVKNLIIYGLSFAVGALGVLACIATIGLFTLPLGWAIGITIACTMLMLITLGIDLYAWKSGLGSREPGKHDKLYTGCMITLMVGSLALSGFLTFGMGLSVIPFALGMIVGLPALGILVGTYVKLHIDQKKKERERDDLNRFVKATDFKPNDANTPLTAETKKLFKKLPKKVRQAVRAKYLEQENRDNFTLNENNTHILQSAVKKTASVYWEKWQRSGNEEDKKYALVMEKVAKWLNEPQRNKQQIQVQLKHIQQNAAELYDEFTDTLYYLAQLEKSVGTLRTNIQKVHKEMQDAAANSRIPFETFFTPQHRAS